MQLTGFDTILFTFQDPVLLVRELQDLVSTEHTDAEFDVEHVQPDRPSIENATRDQCAAAFSTSIHAILYIYFRTELRGHLEENGYVLTPFGDGSMALHVRHRRAIAFHMTGINEVHQNDGPVPPPEPYIGWMCSPLVYEVTLVTSGNPKDHDESRRMIEALINICIQK